MRNQGSASIVTREDASLKIVVQDGLNLQKELPLIPMQTVEKQSSLRMICGMRTVIFETLDKPGN